MKTIFNEKTANELLARINNLEATQPARWGKMDAFQMLRHCTKSEEMFHGKVVYKRLFIGKLFGRMALKGILKNEEPLKRNQPTHPDLKIVDTGNFERERERWIQLLKGYSAYSNPNFVHPFFGKMTKEEVGKYVYKHTDHHLRQFNQ